MVAVSAGSEAKPMPVTEGFGAQLGYEELGYEVGSGGCGAFVVEGCDDDLIESEGKQFFDLLLARGEGEVGTLGLEKGYGRRVECEGGGVKVLGFGESDGPRDKVSVSMMNAVEIPDGKAEGPWSSFWSCGVTCYGHRLDEVGA